MIGNNSIVVKQPTDYNTNQPESLTGQGVAAYYQAICFKQGEPFVIRASRGKEQIVFFGILTELGILLWETEHHGKDSDNLAVYSRAEAIHDPAAHLRKLGEAGYGIFSYPNHVSGGLGNKHAKAFTTLFFEDDKRSLDEQLARLEILKSLGIDPTLVIYSGGKSYHSYIALTDDIGPERWQLLNRMLSIVMDSDPTINTLARAMRLPGVPRVGKDGQVREVEIIYQSDHRYDADFIENALLSTGLFPYGLSDQRWQKYQSGLKKSPGKALKFLTIPEDELNPSFFTNNRPSITLGKGEYIPLDVAISKANRENLLGVSDYRNSTGTALAKDLYGTAQWLISNGFRTDDPYNLFLVYCQKCSQGNGWDEREWGSVWKSATRGNPHPSTPDNGLWNCVNAYLYKEGLPFTAFYDKHPVKSVGDKLKDWILSRVKRVKPKGFGQRAQAEEFEGDRASTWLDIIAQGKDVLDCSDPGAGKSHGVINLENPYEGRIWYLCQDPRDPSIPGIADKFTLLPIRTKHGFFRNENGKLVEANKQTPEGLIEIEGNCSRADLFPALINQGYDPNSPHQDDKQNPICATCPQNRICSVFEGMFRHDRHESLASPYIRCHPNSLPRPKTEDNPNGFDYSKDIFVIEEPSVLLKPSRNIKSDWQKLVLELDKYRPKISQVNPDLWQELDAIFQRIRPLFDNQERYGLTHSSIIQALQDVTISDELIDAIAANPIDLTSIFPNNLGKEASITLNEPNFKGLNKQEKAKVKQQIRDSNRYLREEAYRETQANLDSLPPNAILSLLLALKGESGIILRIQRGSLILTLNHLENYQPMLQATLGNIYLDGTIRKQRLEMITGTNRPIKAIRSKGGQSSNLTVQVIETQGVQTSNISDTAIARVQLLIETLRAKHGHFPILSHKRLLEILGLDGYWFRDNRGSNDFEASPYLLSVGLPWPNLGAIEDEYLAVNGNLDGFEEYYQSLVYEEVIQWAGRQRANRYGDQQFTLFMIVPPNKENDQKSIDLSFLSQYGITVKTKTAFEIHPETGTEVQCVRHRLINAVKECLTLGIKTTQTAIAQILGISQPAVSKALSKAKVSIQELVSLVEGLLKKYNHPLDDPYRTGYIPYELYQDLALFFDLPIEQIAADAVNQIINQGWEVFKENLKLLPDGIQAIYLGALWAILQDDSLIKEAANVS